MANAKGDNQMAPIQPVPSSIETAKPSKPKK